MQTVGERVRDARVAAGLSQRELARLVGTSQQAIQNLERKGSGGSSHLVAIANALGVTAEWLWSGAGTKELVASPRKLSNDLVRLTSAAPVIGAVAAGIWREEQVAALDLTQVDEYIPVLPTRAHQGMKQYGLKVQGDSMNRVVKDGEMVAIVLCEDGASYAPNDIVVVERNREGLYETTLKRLIRITPDAIVLEPESDDPRYVTYIMKRDDDAEARIIGIAVGKYAPF